jgi:hypothetical protein
MAVSHITYLNLTLKQRKAAATRVREQIRTALANPFLADNQRMTLQAQIERITHWERGTLDIGAPFAQPAPEPPPAPDSPPDPGTES